MRFLFPRAPGKWGCGFQAFSSTGGLIWPLHHGGWPEAEWEDGEGVFACRSLGSEGVRVTISTWVSHASISLSAFSPESWGSCSHSQFQLCFRGLRKSNVHSWAPWNGERRGNRWSGRKGTAVQKVVRLIARRTYVSWQQQTLGYPWDLWLKI